MLLFFYLYNIPLQIFYYPSLKFIKTRQGFSRHSEPSGPKISSLSRLFKFSGCIAINLKYHLYRSRGSFEPRIESHCGSSRSVLLGYAFASHGAFCPTDRLPSFFSFPLVFVRLIRFRAVASLVVLSGVASRVTLWPSFKRVVFPPLFRTPSFRVFHFSLAPRAPRRKKEIPSKVYDYVQVHRASYRGWIYPSRFFCTKVFFTESILQQKRREINCPLSIFFVGTVE